MDAGLTLRADLEAAHRYRITGTGPFTRRLLPGGHFFPVTHRPDVLHEIRTALARQDLDGCGPRGHSRGPEPVRRTLSSHNMIKEATA